MTHRTTALVGATILALAAPALSGAQKKSTAAPDFTAEASDGKTYTLKTLTAEKPLVLYFIKRGCPTNAEAVQYFQAIHAAYKGKANIVGVIDGDKQEFKQWKPDFNVSFPVLFDPAMKIIRDYRAAASPTVIVVGTDQIVSLNQRGYSQSSLETLNATAAKIAGYKMVQVDFKGTPKVMTFG